MQPVGAVVAVVDVVYLCHRQSVKVTGRVPLPTVVTSTLHVAPNATAARPLVPLSLGVRGVGVDVDAVLPHWTSTRWDPRECLRRRRVIGYARRVETPTMPDARNATSATPPAPSSKRSERDVVAASTSVKKLLRRRRSNSEKSHLMTMTVMSTMTLGERRRSSEQRKQRSPLALLPF